MNWRKAYNFFAARVNLLAPTEIAACLAVTIGSSLIIYFLAKKAEESAQYQKIDYIAEEKISFLQAKQRIEKSLISVYQDTRLISLLPSVREIRGGNLRKGSKKAFEIGRFNPNDWETIQNIFSSMANNSVVSEIYCVLDGYNPAMGETPFFELDLNTSRVNDIFEFSLNENVWIDKPKEFEDDERAWLASNLPIIKRDHPLFNFNNMSSIPAFVSGIMLTCDNAHYTSIRKGDANETSGIIIAVPFYGFDGRFKGVIASILLAQVLEAALLNRPFIPITEKDFTQAASERWTLPEKPSRLMLTNDQSDIRIFDRRSKYFVIKSSHEAIASSVLNISGADFAEKLKVHFGGNWELSQAVDQRELDKIDRDALLGTLLSMSLFCVVNILLIWMIFKNAELRKRDAEEAEKELVIEVAQAKVAAETARAEELSRAYTELQDMQEKLIQSEKMKAIGQLASGVAHEVRNPLGVIIQAVACLDDALPPEDKESRETLSLVKESAERADKIAISILNFSKETKLDLQPEDINPILEKSLSLSVLIAKNVKVVRELQEHLPWIDADKNKLMQVFINLFTNAVQSMPKGGKMTLRSFVQKREEIHNCIAAGSSDYYSVGENVVVVEVEDTGEGIPEKNSTKIFNPFFTTKGPQIGTGLGLAITQNIIIMHKGLMGFTSQVGVGTKFVVVLKISKDLRGGDV